MSKIKQKHVTSVRDTVRRKPGFVCVCVFVCVCAHSSQLKYGDSKVMLQRNMTFKNYTDISCGRYTLEK